MSYDDFSMDVMYMNLLTLYLLVDADLVMLANPTHIWSTWAIHINQIDGGRCGIVPVTTY
jgi:hypothetical protein